jgi:hypothetical protein
MKPAAEQEVLVDWSVIRDCGCSRRWRNQLLQIEFVRESKLILILGCPGWAPFHEVGSSGRRAASSELDVTGIGSMLARK